MPALSSVWRQACVCAGQAGDEPGRAYRHGQRREPVDYRPAARAAVQRLRARSSVVLTGADTVLADDARLTVRPDELGLGAELMLWRRRGRRCACWSMDACAYR